MSPSRARTIGLAVALGAGALGLAFPVPSGNGESKPSVHAGTPSTAQATLPDGATDADDLPDEERIAYENALLDSAVPAPDRDGNPATIEGVLPDGRRVVVFVKTSEPKDFEGVDIDELSDDGRSPPGKGL